MSILGVGYVGKRNQPLFVHSFDQSEGADLELNLTIHSMLDVVEERCSNQVFTSTTGGEEAFYLGFLSLFGRFCTFGMMGPTLVKVFLVLDAEYEPTGKEEEIKRLLFSLHLAYLDFICNPFVELGASGEDNVDHALYQSKSFVSKVSKICESNQL